MRVAGEFNRRSAPVASRAAPRAQGSRARSVAAGDPFGRSTTPARPILLATMRRNFLTTARSYGRQSHPRSGGASPETIPRRSGEWRPAAAARTAPREVRDPVRQALSLGAEKSLSAPVPLPETAARVPGRKSPRWSAERGPGRTGAWWSRLARATKRRVRLSALHSPLGRGEWDCCCRQGYERARPPKPRRRRRKEERQTRAHERAAGTKKTALFDIVK